MCKWACDRLTEDANFSKKKSSFHIKFILIRNNNCSIDFYNRDLQTTITLFTRNVSSHKTHWILSESPLLALSCLLYRVVSSLMNTLEGEYLCLREIPINVNKLLAVLLLHVLFNECTWRGISLPSRNPYKCKQIACSFIVACFVYMLFFILHLLLFVYFFILFYFCLFIDHVNKPIILVFAACVYHFKNTISIFVTIISGLEWLLNAFLIYSQSKKWTYNGICYL